MTGARDYEGCHTVIYDSCKARVLCEGTVTRFNSSAFVITIPRPIALSHIPERVSLRIFHPMGVYEYMGSPRQREIQTPEIDIALYQGSLSNARTAPRYPLNTTITVSRSTPDENVNTAQVTLVNLSRSGCLVRAASGVFYPEDQFCVYLPIEGGRLTLRATVVRLSPAPEGMSDYGCTLECV